MRRLEAIVAELPEAERIDIEAWDDHPAFKVRKKNFVFADQAAESMSIKLSKDEAAAVVGTDDSVEPLGYGLGRHGWISFAVDADADEERWEIIREWVRTSYTLVAPKSLVRVVLEEDARSAGSGGGGVPGASVSTGE
jgi:predicted DNA-binding protein (MmcQ/YjbR family)